MSRLGALVQKDSILLDSENIGKMTDQFIISLSLFGRCSDGHSDILIINLCYFTFPAIGLGLDHEGQSILFGDDTLRHV